MSAPAHLRFVDRRHLRQWLTDHPGSCGIWVLTCNTPGSRRLSYCEIAQEAICFGWMNTLRRRDGQSGSAGFLVLPRPPGSVWSVPDKDRVAIVVAEGRMHPRGTAVVHAAQQDGSWRALDEVLNLL